MIRRRIRSKSRSLLVTVVVTAAVGRREVRRGRIIMIQDPFVGMVLMLVVSTTKVVKVSAMTRRRITVGCCCRYC